ncbi:DUF6124 family protein [Pseudomonas sp. 10S4]|uniref:DUF6124 family protein n=1 Tax=Pseudomonas sp. 10S4 TaxID=3048583 RepID=UPI002AC9BC25|nr:MULTISPECIES: DUF6124 family protein [unclassified Pseudomonas]MEB0225030.1 DUF6124 family protein [Pseudomonas sp. 5S1]MEB0296989.1 DUF6124 family protein [Pseudomonas sp. 10S4]WPX16586.1 DUF6124 family protein [Pseudomonas sp. 10S4]
MLDKDVNPSETPESPKTDSTPVCSCLNSKKLHDALIHAIEQYLTSRPSKPPLADRRRRSFFLTDPSVDKESLLAHCCETLASANVMASELAFSLTGPQCNLMLGIQQMISLAEVSANRVLDQVDPQE